MTPLREALTAAIVARLAAEIPDVPVERARRGEVPVSDFPRLVVRAGDVGGGEEIAHGESLYTVEVLVTGHARAPDGTAGDALDLEAERALGLLHARVVKALVAWQPDGVDLAQVRASAATEFLTYDLDESAEAAGEFTATFEAESIRPTGHLYAA